MPLELAVESFVRAMSKGHNGDFLRIRLFALAWLLFAGTANAQSLVPPRMTNEPVVPYPTGATGDKTVLVLVVIAADGAVTEAKAKAEGAHEPFASAAEAAVKALHFDPAIRDGKPVGARIKIEIVFYEPAKPEAEAHGETHKPAAARPALVDEVVVRGAHVEPGRSASLTRAEVRQIPGTFGDPFRAIEVMPGVTPIVTGLPFFFVRGAPPSNVGYYLDGVRVPLIFHVGVGPSVIHPALMDRVDLYPGGYPARFGRFAGGIVSGETVAPDNELHGEYNIRLFDVGALAETGFDKGRGTVLLAGRYSYTAAILSLFSSSTTLDYWDYQARVTYDLTPDDRVSAFSFGSYDFLGQKDATTGTNQTIFGTQFHRVDFRYDHRISADATLRTAMTLGNDRSEASDSRFVRDRLVGGRTEIDWRLSQKVTIRAGTDLQLDHYEVQANLGVLGPSTAVVAALFPTRSDLAFGGRVDAIFAVTPRFELTPGVRLDLFASEGNTALGADPRLAMRTVVTKRIKWLAALGVAHQPPAFVVPVPGFQPGGLDGGLQKAYQESTGLELELGSSTMGTASVYHNAFRDMSDPLGASPPDTSGCAPGQFPSDTLTGDRITQPARAGNCGLRFTPGTLGPDRTGGGGQGAESKGSTTRANALSTRTNGSAYGLELMLKRKLTSRLGGFLSYTLSRSERTSNGRTYIASFDRTHVLNAALAFDLGRNWRAGTRVTFYTGLPKAADPTETNTATRLSPFFRLDLRLEKRWQLGQKAWITFVAEMMNATLSKESVSTTCTLDGCNETTIGPVSIPSLGLEGGF